MTPYALDIEHLTVHYEGSPALWDVHVQVPVGSFVGIIGPNGAGKSTFMKTVLGLIKPISGRVLICGKQLKEMRGKIAYIPQREAIDWTFPITVRELVFMGLYPKRGLFGFRTKEDDKHVDAALKQVGLEEYANREIGKLSGGQQQRAFLARALVQEADVYFLDEPLSGVDHASEQLIMRLLHAMQKSGKTIFMIHHDLNNVEKYFNWLILLNVRVIRSGVTKDVFTGDLLKEAYGKNFMLYDETVKRASEKILGKQ